MLTLGGLDYDTRAEWTEDTYHELGDCIVAMSSNNPTRKLDGYTRFFELKRQFIKDDWEFYIKKLDTHREYMGFPPTWKLIEWIQQELITEKHTLITPPIKPGPVCVTLPKLSVDPVIEPETVQLDLFALL